MSVRIFFCYAHEDEILLIKLKTHLAPLQKQGLIEPWNDRDISAGTEWEQEISHHLNEAHIILLLISSDFMNSDYCYSVEMKRALELHERKKAHVIPIILRPVYWQGILGKLQVLPKDAYPVTDQRWHTIDQALYNIVEGIRKAIEDLPVLNTVEFAIQEGDMLSVDADVLALKYAQTFYGTDSLIASLLTRKAGVAVEKLSPPVGSYHYAETKNCISAKYALFVGVPDLVTFSYKNIQEFAEQVLTVLSLIAPDTRHLAMTMHGANFGLDEIEAFLAQFVGYFQAFQTGQFPSKLEKITIIENHSLRVKRLQKVFEEQFAHMDAISQIDGKWMYSLPASQPLANVQHAQNYSSVCERTEMLSYTKPHVFVAMPSKKDMDDIFYYGIQQPVRAAGFICERVDQDTFMGEILEQVKRKIETSAIVIADLTGANPNVYLEIGYAWGKGRPTLLLVKGEQEVSFDVHGQKCLKYERIKDLEEALIQELKALGSQWYQS